MTNLCQKKQASFQPAHFHLDGSITLDQRAWKNQLVSDILLHSCVTL